MFDKSLLKIENENLREGKILSLFSNKPKFGNIKSNGNIIFTIVLQNVKDFLPKFQKDTEILLKDPSDKRIEEIDMPDSTNFVNEKVKISLPHFAVKKYIKPTKSKTMLSKKYIEMVIIFSDVRTYF